MANFDKVYKSFDKLKKLPDGERTAKVEFNHVQTIQIFRNLQYS